ncbi:hypothetical protein GCM10027084_24120 [Pseudoxanthomonas sangjuensis]|uniref:hypothetical protein n=1 Tax=Pseudoxanthomonas sangjuensis TaxID=1503750 RepID=UPI001390AD6D|nr:hypothetical protein [Pseudoxanthomonas sangjuensis]KAF1706635.1 hypothetical protein CSC71_13940 [Pseudoxanthomonas sangjuensis]
MDKRRQGRVFGRVSPFVFALLAVAGTGLAADRYRIVNEGGIRDDWALADGVEVAAPGYPAAFVERGDNVCVALGYAIKPDGTTSDFAVLKSWSSGTAADGKEPAAGYWDAFTQASANAVAQWKFKPREQGATPRQTYTVATVSFNGKPAMDPTSLRGQCAIGDLTSFLQEQKATAFRYSREKQEMENVDLNDEQRRMEKLARELERAPRGQ